MYEYTDDIDHYISPNYLIEDVGKVVGVRIRGQMSSVSQNTGYFAFNADDAEERKRWIGMFRELADSLEAIGTDTESEVPLYEYDFRRGMRKV